MEPKKRAKKGDPRETYHHPVTLAALAVLAGRHAYRSCCSSRSLIADSKGDKTTDTDAKTSFKSVSEYLSLRTHYVEGDNIEKIASSRPTSLLFFLFNLHRFLIVFFSFLIVLFHPSFVLRSLIGTEMSISFLLTYKTIQ